MRLLQKFKPKKLNASGIGHHALVAIIVISTIAGLGAWRVWSSSAATLNSSYQRYVANQPGCELSGRVWNSTKSECLAKCRAGTGVYRTIKGSDGATRGFCTEAVAESMNTVAEAKRCIETLKRFYIREIGCARRPAQDNANNAKQCIGYNTSQPYKNYVAEGGVDRCVAPTLAQTGSNTGATAAEVATDPIDRATCLAMGRSYNTTKNACNRDCRADTGLLIVHSNGSRYCGKAVTTNTGQALCGQLHRRWTPAGCARRADQIDNPSDTISCLPGFPFYNANSKASTTGMDVCEQNATVAASNEKAGILGAQAPKPATNSTSGSGSGASSSTAGAADTVEDEADVAIEPTNTSKFKIVLYTEKDFKGDHVTITEATPDLGTKWGNKVSSYKITGGRWQLCPDKDYKANKNRNCVRPWASDPNLSDAKSKTHMLDNQITSVRPVVREVFTETTNDVPPACTAKDGKPVAATADGTCPADTALKCPAPLELKNGECKEKTVEPQIIVPVDKTFKGKTGQEHCELLGREWIGKPAGNKTINGGEYGCSMYTCERERDGAPVQAKDGPVCVNYQFDAAYAVLMTRKACSDLHRVYVSQVKRCAQVPNRKDKNQTIVNARQCRDSSHTVYFIFRENGKNDECFKPNYFKKAQGAAKSVRGSLGSALKMGPKQYCNTVKKGNYHWNGKRCVIDRKTCWNGDKIAVTKSCPAQPNPVGGRGASGSGSDTGGTEQSAADKCRAGGNKWISDGRGEQYGYCNKTISCTSSGFCYDSDNPLGIDPTRNLFPTSDFLN